MADSKISALPAATVPLAGTEVLPIVQSSTTKQVSVANLTAGRAISASSVTNSALTSGRVTYASTSGLLTDSANLAFTGTKLTLRNPTAGAAQFSQLSIGMDNDPDQLYLQSFSSTYTSASFNRASGGQINGEGLGGLTLASTQADMTFVTGVAGVGAGTVYMTLGQTGIVTMSAYGAGAATFSASGVISSVSDETWKTKDGVPNNPDAMLKKLEPGYWFYNDEKKETFGTDRQLGFYAQNVHEAIGPEAAPTPETYVTTDKDGAETTHTKPWGYYDRSVLAVVVMSLKNALSTIEQQQTAIDDLTARLTKAGL
jgi:hypothetical protein